MSQSILKQSTKQVGQACTFKRYGHLVYHYTLHKWFNGTSATFSLSYKKHETCETRVSTKKTSYNKCSWWLAAKLLQSKLLAKAWPCSSSCGAGPSKNGANSVLKSHHF
jgi:hypothetical protein